MYSTNSVFVGGIHLSITKEYLFENYIKLDKSQRQIAQELGTTESTIDYWTRKYKLTYKKSNRDKVFNLSHIDKTDCIFCYFAGLMATDGYFDYKNNRVSLRVNNLGSYDVLNNIRNYFGYIRPIRVYNGKDNDLTIPNECIFEELKSMGIFGKKVNRSFSLDWFNSADYDCKRMFIRGVADGDGHFNPHGCEFVIAMKSRDFIDNLLSVFNNVCKDVYTVKYYKYSRGNKYPSIHLHKKDTHDLFTKIYSGYEKYRFLDKYERAVSS